MTKDLKQKIAEIYKYSGRREAHLVDIIRELQAQLESFKVVEGAFYNPKDNSVGLGDRNHWKGEPLYRATKTKSGE